MPRYDVELSDGRTVTLEGDSEPSENDVLKALGVGAPTAEPSPFRKAIRDAAAAFTGGVLGPEASLQAGFPAKALSAPSSLIEKSGIPQSLEEVGADFLRRTGINPAATAGVPLAPSREETTFIPSPLEQAFPNATKGVEEAAREFTTPGQALLAPFAGLKPVQMGFEAQMLAGVPQSVQELASANTTEERAKAAAQAGIGLLAGRKVIRDLLPGSVPPDALVPAVRKIGGEIVPGEKGETHPDIIEKNDIKAKDIDQRGFSDPEGKVFVDREAAAKATQAPTEFEPGRLHSTDLAKAQEKAPGETKPPEPATETPIPATKLPESETKSQIVETLAEPPKELPAPEEPKVSTPSDASPTQSAQKSGKTLKELTEKVEAGGKLTPSEKKRYLRLRDEATGQEPPQEPPVVQAGAAHISEIPETGRGADIYGIAARIRDERAKAGQTIKIDPGEGIDPLNAVMQGQEILSRDANAAQKAVDEFGATKKISYEGMTATRAKAEQSFSAARKIEEQFGTDSDQFRQAFSEAVKWDIASKGMQTEWHKTGQAQQGFTDLDTGSFTGLQRAYREATDKDFTPEQSEKATKVAKGVKDSTAAVETAKAEFSKELRNLASNPDEAALAAAHKTVREAAARLAEEETKARVAKTVTEKARAKEQIDAAKKAIDAAQKMAREAAAKLAESERKRLANPQIAVWEKAKIYLDQGMDDFADIRNKVATDLGMPVSKVSGWLTYTKRAKYLADDLLLKQQKERRLREDAKRWLSSLSVPKWRSILGSIPRVMFGLKVWGHGFVALGTHAPAVAFQPRFWDIYARDYATMARMVTNKAFYEQQMQDLVRRPNYAKAMRAGLVNDPFVFEDYNSPDTVKFFTGGGAGNRGYSVLKILRQDMFDRMWNKLPKTSQIDEVAKAIADGVNHATGVVKGRAHPALNVAFFAPRLEASRVAWLAVDPIKAAMTFKDWKTASEGEKAFAINQVKEKAWVAATALGILAANQGVLSATGSKQKINFANPMQSDWLKFKAAGMQMSYGNALLSMARLPARFWQIRSSDGGKLKYVIYPDENMYNTAGEFARSQLSPFSGVLVDQLTGLDFSRRPLPSSNRPVPARLRKMGVKPYTWTEYVSQALAPIPAQEAMKEVWHDGFGLSERQVDAMTKALATISFMGLTGGRLQDDWTLEKK